MKNKPYVIINASGTNLITNTSVFTKVYFPHRVIPLTPVLPNWQISLSVLYFLLIMMMAATGVGCWLKTGCITKGVSITHFRNDSFYTYPVIALQDPMSRKTILDKF